MIATAKFFRSANFLSLFDFGLIGGAISVDAVIVGFEHELGAYDRSQHARRVVTMGEFFSFRREGSGAFLPPRPLPPGTGPPEPPGYRPDPGPADIGRILNLRREARGAQYNNRATVIVFKTLFLSSSVQPIAVYSRIDARLP